MNRLFVTIYFACALLFSVDGQTEVDIFKQLESSTAGQGNIEIKQDKGIADLISKHINQNKNLVGIEGWRIQLFSGAGVNAKKEAQDVKGRAMSEFPNEKVYLIYNAPFWWVRVGDFRDKSESLYLYYELKRKFSSCYPVKDDKVQFSESK